MARRRMISPEIWGDGRVLKLTDLGKLLWVGLITQADDEGIFESDADVIKAAVHMHASPLIVQRSLDHIVQLTLAIPYEDGIQPLAFLPSFYKHQWIDRPTPTKHARPAWRTLLDYPDYIAARAETFNRPGGRYNGLFDKNGKPVGDKSTTCPRHVNDVSLLVESRSVQGGLSLGESRRDGCSGVADAATTANSQQPSATPIEEEQAEETLPEKCCGTCNNWPVTQNQFLAGRVCLMAASRGGNTPTMADKGTECTDWTPKKG